MEDTERMEEKRGLQIWSLEDFCCSLLNEIGDLY